MPDSGAASGTQGKQRRLGEYELLEPIGRGGMGIVYKARQTSLNRLVALKMLGPHGAAFPGIADRLRIEAEVAGSLRHPHIVTIFDVGEHEGQPFFTMALIDGVGLDKSIGPDGFRAPGGDKPATETAFRSGPEADVVRTMIQIAQAVDYAHKHGVLHRDLKPANILIDARGEPHLTDFGLAKALGRSGTAGTASGAIMGTPAYMAPEQAAGDAKHASTVADVYSLGAILYEMLTGRPPFRAETPLETLRRVVEEIPKPPSTFNRNLDADLAIICLKCLEKDPHHRYNSAGALAEDLDRWLKGEPIEARSVHRVERLWRWCRREPVLSGLIAGIAILLTLTSILGLTAYRVTRNRLSESAQRHETALRQLDQRIAIAWENPETRFVALQPEELSIMAGRTITRDLTDTVVKLGVHFPGIDRRDPQQKITIGYPALAHYLYTNSPIRRVLCSVHIYKSSSNAADGLLSGEVDIMQLSPASYIEARLQARHRGIELTPIIAQIHGGHPLLQSAIFTHTNSPIRDLAGLRGQRIAFNELDAAIGFHLPMLQLLEAGVRRRDLGGWTNTRPWHATTLVRNGFYTAGVADHRDLTNLIAAGAPLRILRSVTGPTTPWIATTNLAPEVRAAIQESLVGLTDSDILGGISRGLTGFRKATAADYDQLEQQMIRARQFDDVTPPAR